MVTCCTHCGADLSYRPPGGVLGVWPENCPDCGLVQSDDVLTLAPGDNEIEYAVVEWAPRDRILLRNALTERGVPWRWEPGPVLVVDERDEGAVEAVLDDLEQAEDGGELSGDFDEDLPEDADEAVEDDVRAHEAMGDLFVAANRLARTPDNGLLVGEIDRLAAFVGRTRAPYGVDAHLWDDVRRLSLAVSEAGDSGDGEAVQESAERLRDLLRDYV
jgi:hypothetical protein